MGFDEFNYTDYMYLIQQIFTPVITTYKTFCPFFIRNYPDLK